jgi:hypothetical protein
MSDGHYCIVRDLGPVKGGKGMKHHEVIIDFNRRGIVTFLSRRFARSGELELSHSLKMRLDTRESS